MQAVKYAEEEYLNDSLAKEHIVKRKKLNPPGQNMYLRGDKITSEIEVILRIQRQFKERYYVPDGPWFIKKFALETPGSSN